MVRSKPLFLLIAVFALLFFGCDSDDDTNKAPVISNETATPATLGTNQTDNILITAEVLDSNLSTVTADLSAVPGFATATAQEMYDDGTNGDVTASDGIYSYRMAGVNTSSTPTTYDVIVKATDSKGKASTKTITITIIASPSITNFGFSPASPAEAQDITFTGDVAAGANPIASVSIDLSSISGSSTQAMYDDGTNGDVTASDGTYTYKYHLPNGTDGNRLVTMSATDNGTPAITTTSVNSFSVTNLTNYPALTNPSTTPTNPSSAATTLDIGVDFTFGDVSVGTIKVDLSALGGGANVNMNLAGVSAWINSAAISPSAAGTFTITFRLSDGATPESYITLDHQVTVVTTPPAISNFQTSVAGPFEPGDSVTFTATVTPGTYPLASADPVTLDLSNLGGGTAIAMTNTGGNNYSYTYTIPSAINTGVTPGTPLVRLNTKDNQTPANTDSDDINVTISNVRPSIDWFNGYGMQGSTETLEVVISEGNGYSDIVSATIDLTPIGGTSQNLNYNSTTLKFDCSYAIPSSLLGTSVTGYYELLVEIADNAGEKTNLLVPFIVYTGTIYYADVVSGSDTTGNGTQGAPWESINYAISQSSNGDLILCADSDSTNKYTGNISFQNPGLKKVAIKSINGPTKTIMDCTGTTVAINFATLAGETNECIFSGFTVTRAYNSAKGGAIPMENASPVISDCYFDTNSADNHGGAIYVLSSSTVASPRPVISLCYFSANQADGGNGGAIGVFADLGAGAYPAEVKISNSVFIANIANNTSGNVSGGAIWCYQSAVFLSNCLFSENWCYATTTGNVRGGAVYISQKQSGSNTGTQSTIDNCLFADNMAESTGGHAYGGGLCTFYADITLNNCTFANNEVTANAATKNAKGGGISFNSTGSAYSDVIVMNNSIVWGNTVASTSGTASAAQILFVISSASGSIILNFCDYDTAAATPTNIEFEGTLGTATESNCFYTNPQFQDQGATANYDNYFLNQASPCVDAVTGTQSSTGNFDKGTTSTDNAPDSGTLDLGFHYPLQMD